MIPYGRQSINQDDLNNVLSALKNDFITQGPLVSQFESNLSEKVQCDYAVVFNSGTSALHAAYFAIGLKKGDEFITTPISFVATSNAGLYLGAKPVFVDVNQSGNIDHHLIEANISSKTKAIVPVHYSGNPVNLKEIYHIAKNKKLMVIEDACHAVGAFYDNKPIGACEYSDATVFSFHPVKHITTGEGGAVLTNNKRIFESLVQFRSHGINKNNTTEDEPWLYEMEDLGYNYRITDIQCALGISQLNRLDQFVSRRQEIARLYDEAFLDKSFVDVIKPLESSSSSYHLYPIFVKNANVRKIIFKELRSAGINCQVHYIPIPSQPYYKNLGYKSESFPEANKFYEREISIPMFPDLTNEQVSFIIKTVLMLTEKNA
ncbi:MAG: UDP-4-amino-4,6-dideoxy-N-acetyl-beta-L-altrosamine transaminase [Planctomycetota bacterium]|nr:MAG: UDP-4-amino-4,6-dideoxy-N-acetyl-beta-L-altrosamine transaminase [Planctomycetota bacterium]